MKPALIHAIGCAVNSSAGAAGKPSRGSAWTNCSPPPGPSPRTRRRFSPPPAPRPSGRCPRPRWVCPAGNWMPGWRNTSANSAASCRPAIAGSPVLRTRASSGPVAAGCRRTRGDRAGSGSSFTPAGWPSRRIWNCTSRPRATWVCAGWSRDGSTSAACSVAGAGRRPRRRRENCYTARPARGSASGWRRRNLMKPRSAPWPGWPGRRRGRRPAPGFAWATP